MITSPNFWSALRICLLSAIFLGLGFAVMCTCAAMRARVEAIAGECCTVAWGKLEKTSEIGISWRDICNLLDLLGYASPHAIYTNFTLLLNFKRDSGIRYLFEALSS